MIDAAEDKERTVRKVDGSYPNVTVCSHPVVLHKVTQMRRADTSGKHVRELLKEVTHWLGYLATQNLLTKPHVVDTPIASFSGHELSSKVALIPVLRSGNGMLEPMLDILPCAPVFHMGMYRDQNRDFPVMYYNKLPSKCNVDVAIVLEPLIASANTMKAVLDILHDEWECPKVIIVSILASKFGIEQLHADYPNVQIFCADIDERLTKDGYISPGLGDIGDRLNNSCNDAMD